MPQMAPIWWSTLFISFILAYIMVMILMYFLNIYKMNNDQIKKSNNINNINWKW